MPLDRRIEAQALIAEMADAEQAEESAERVAREIAAHEATRRELQSLRKMVDARGAQDAAELGLINARLEFALRCAKVHVFTQDRDLRYTWVHAPDGAAAGADMLGRTDADILPAADRDAVIALKRSVMESGIPAHTELFYMMSEGHTLVALHVDPSYDPAGTINGVISAAIDISPVRSLESAHRRLTEELSATLQRYEMALRGSSVTVFVQDRHLTYTSISNPFLGRRVEDIVGRTDEEILPPQDREAILACKHAVLESGSPRDCEAQIQQDGSTFWFDFHIEPLRDIEGEIVGVTGTAVDITQRKDGEAHLRMLMRELTHRSKNLLAVIQAMARQTARHSDSTADFLDRFSARLQALATSHDLLVQEGWHGASLHELVRMQLGHYIDGGGSRIAFDGPTILLKPEAAQALGLGLHELATNAAKHGALSSHAGQVAINWRRLPASDGNGLELTWREAGGPLVPKPSRRGFGTMVLERHIANSLDGDVSLVFAPSGVECRIVVPLTQFVPVR
jgi:PAS domain S-box-containing protein